MSLYKRYVSGEHDKEHFRTGQKQITHGRKKTNSIDQGAQSGILLPFFNDDPKDYKSESRDQNTLLSNWMDILQNAVIFVGYDDVMFHHVVSIISLSATTSKLSAQSITKFGFASYPDLKLDPNSRFWPSCENLLPQHRNSNVRQALAVLNLKNSNRMLNHHRSMDLPMWDETNAGALASSMRLIQSKSPEHVGRKLLELGLVQHQQVHAFTLDVIYDNECASEEIVEENNQLVSLLGEQLDQIFDPLLEYAPEEIKEYYTPSTKRELVHYLNPKIQSILEEIVNVQTNYTAGLVNLLQTFIIPLRASALGKSSVDSSSAIHKINQIFPPTIDEITRVNCILNDSLLNARKVDDIEVVIAMGTIMPYFYKPFIRHEANVKHFNENLTKFAEKYKKRVFENLKLNSSQYTVREIDSIVTGALLELPKFKLLLQRLHEAIEFEETQLRNFDNNRPDDNLRLVNLNYTSAMDVIYAFSGADEHKVEAKRRVFTPTGRMLTDIADNWPSELQFDWNSRKVVGIYQLDNVARTNLSGSEILAVFSDYLLFFTVQGCDHKKIDNDDRTKTMSVADALMHSLINEKPIPNLETFPAMQVTAWCRIDEVLVTKYLTLDESNAETECLRFLSLNSGGFKSSIGGAKAFTRNYQVTGKRSPAEDIITAVEKSKILYKSSSFHLFRSANKGMHVSYTAQLRYDYETETCKLPFALFLNIDVDVPCYFEQHPQLVLLLKASMVSDDEIKVTGYDRYAKQQINDNVKSNEFSRYVEHMVEKAFYSLFSTYNTVTKNVIEGNLFHLRYLTEQYLNNDSGLEKPTCATSNKVNVDYRRNQSSSRLQRSPPKPLSSRSSILSKLHLKNSKNADMKPHPVKPTRKISNTFIPKGTKLEYKEVYKPVPKLQRKETSSTSMVIESPTEAPVNDTTNRCTSAPSIDVSPNFQFPRVDHLDEIETNNSVTVDHEVSTIKRLSTMDDISIVLRLSQDPSMGDYYYDDYDRTPNWEFVDPKNAVPGGALKHDLMGVPAQWGANELVEVYEDAIENAPASVDYNQVQHGRDTSSHRKKGDHSALVKHQFNAPPIPSFVESATSRKPSNESLIFSHVAGNPSAYNTLTTPPISSSSNGLMFKNNSTGKSNPTTLTLKRSHFPRDESSRSMSAHEVALEFSRLIDVEFSKPPLEAAIGSVLTSPSTVTETIPPSPLNTLTPFHTNSSVVTLVSNDSSSNVEVFGEESHLSIDDQEGDENQVRQGLYQQSRGTQETLIAKNEDANVVNMHLSETTTKPLNEFMRDDSISQLTNLLQSSIWFSDFDVEAFH